MPSRLINWAAEAGDCVDPKTAELSPAPCQLPLQPVSDGFSDPRSLRKDDRRFLDAQLAVLRSVGARSLLRYLRQVRHGGATTTGKMLAETAARAASQHEIYQELMHTPGSKQIDALANSIGWDDDFGRQEQKLIAAGLPKILTEASARNFVPTRPNATRSLHCGTPQADPGCQIEQRFILPGCTRTRQRGCLRGNSLRLPDVRCRPFARGARSAHAGLESGYA